VYLPVGSILLTHTHTHTHTHIQREELGAAGARANYDKLDVDGFASPGQDVGEGDIVIGKTVLVPQTDKYDQAPQATKRDSSTRLRHNENGAVDQVRVCPCCVPLVAFVG
jgi:DNA-directed RNA polymerase beta subunit